MCEKCAIEYPYCCENPIDDEVLEQEENGFSEEPILDFYGWDTDYILT